jgi:hypothetical protein
LEGRPHWFGWRTARLATRLRVDASDEYGECANGPYKDTVSGRGQLGTDPQALKQRDGRAFQVLEPPGEDQLVDLVRRLGEFLL